MPSRFSVPLTLIVVLFAFLPPSAYGQKSMPPQSAESAQAQPQTVIDMRNVGTALFLWLVDQVDDDNNPLLTVDQVENSACASSSEGKPGDPCKVAYIDRLPIISYQELTQLLVPRYINAIPERDGWGQPYEFRLDRKNILNRSVMAIRSSGSDRAFSGNRYESGAFLPLEADQDLVWMDGFFIRYPQRKDIKDPK